METIHETKKALMKKAGVLKENKKIQECQFSWLFLLSVEENVALWEGKPAYAKDSLYFYTDLAANPLLDAQMFKAATPISSSMAFVDDFINFGILDFNQREFVVLPRENDFKKTNGFRHGNLAVLSKKTNRWGSYFYDADSHCLALDVPTIWGGLEFSREEEKVYIAQPSLTILLDGDVTTKYDEHSFAIQFFPCKAEKKEIYDTLFYDWYNEYHQADFYRLHIDHRYDSSLLPQRNVLIEECVCIPHDFSDFYFEENYKPIYGSNDGTIVDFGSKKEYKKVRGCLKK